MAFIDLKEAKKIVKELSKDPAFSYQDKWIISLAVVLQNLIDKEKDK